MARPVNQNGINLVKSFEGLLDGNPATVKLDPYLDPVDIWTIGWGHVVEYHGRRLEGERDRDLAGAAYPGGISESEAEQILALDLMDAGRDVSSLVRVPLNDNEFAALTSFCFNVGPANLKNSTLLRKVNEDDRMAAADQFGRWVLAKGVQLPGLVRRRRAERDLFVKTPA